MIQIYNIIATNMEFVTTFTGVVTDITHEDNYIDGIPEMDEILWSPEVSMETTDNEIISTQMAFVGVGTSTLSNVLDRTLVVVVSGRGTATTGCPEVTQTLVPLTSFVLEVGMTVTFTTEETLKLQFCESTIEIATEDDAEEALFVELAQQAQQSQQAREAEDQA
jgi:hypothetical protein